MQIPYKIAGRISHAAMGSRAGCICSTFKEVFFHANFLSLLVQMLFIYSENRNLTSLNPLYVEAVLRHVCSRTWYFSKLFEFIRVKDVTDGKLKLGIAGVSISERSVKSTLTALTESGVLIKLRLPSNIAITPAYGFDFFYMLPFMLLAFENELLKADGADDVEVPRCQVALKAHKQLVILTRFIPYYDSVFDILLNQRNPIEDVNGFVASLKTALADYEPFDLAQELKKVRVKKSELTPGKWRRESDVEHPSPGIEFLLDSHFKDYLDQISDEGIKRVLDHSNYFEFESEPQNTAEAMPDEVPTMN
jgi:hypothetical protein